MTDHSGFIALALTVIERAIIEASHPRSPDASSLAFLTDTSGAWAESFENWCDVLGLGPAWAREKCGEKLLANIQRATARASQAARRGGALPKVGKSSRSEFSHVV